MSERSTSINSPRHTYLVCYDISDDRRLKRVFKVCKNFGTHLQYSVFECDLNPRELIQLQRELKKEIKQDEDQVIFVTLGPTEGRGDRAIFSLGLPYARFDAPCYVV
jgi:CRISPR-associated protein Cas2